MHYSFPANNRGFQRGPNIGTLHYTIHTTSQVQPGTPSTDSKDDSDTEPASSLREDTFSDRKGGFQDKPLDDLILFGVLKKARDTIPKAKVFVEHFPPVLDSDLEDLEELGQQFREIQERVEQLEKSFVDNYLPLLYLYTMICNKFDQSESCLCERDERSKWLNLKELEICIPALRYVHRAILSDREDDKPTLIQKGIAQTRAKTVQEKAVQELALMIIRHCTGISDALSNKEQRVGPRTVTTNPMTVVSFGDFNDGYQVGQLNGPLKATIFNGQRRSDKRS